MSAISKYLNELYLYEEITYIDENFASLAKKLANNKLINILQTASKTKDLNTVKKVISAIPKVEADKLKIIGNKTNKNFDKAYKITEIEVKKQFPELSGDKLKYFTLIITPFVVISNKMEETARDKIVSLKKKAATLGFKKFSSGEGMAGMFLTILAGAFAATAFANLTLFPLLVAIVIAGFAGLCLLEGALE